MAVNVDTVYQRVLAILNKEQRGYLTPQEFNLFANQAQMDLFEQYFYDINQFGRMHGNDTEYADMLNVLNEKINIFEKTASLTYSGGRWVKPADLYRLGTIIYGGTKEAERINANEFLYINASPIAKPTTDRPVFIADEQGYRVYADTELINGVSCNYIRKPATAVWGYTSVSGKALYNAASSTHFELHESEETELVVKILALAGLLVRDLSLYQVGTQKDAMDVQQEKA